MMCTYCGISLQAGVSRCAGCGAPSAMPLAEPAGTASGIYEQIGRAVVDRQPNEALDRLLHIGERENASTRELNMARAGKIMFCLIILWQVPWLLIPIMGIAATFFMWIYLPYKGVKAVLGWLSS